MAFDRQTAYKIPIKEILQSEYVKQDGWDPNYILDSFGRKVSKVNIIGVVASKNDSLNFKSISIDDGSGTIEVRSFSEEDPFKDINIGDVVLVIGKPRAFGNEKYLIGEIIKKTSKEQLKIRHLELEVLSKKAKVEESKKSTRSDEVFKIIKDLDEKEGSADINKVIKTAEEKGINNGEEIIKNLLENGDIFEISPGQLKVIE